MKRSKDKFYMKQIFDCISDGEIIATGKIAKEIGLSEKSVRNRLNELSDFLLENNRNHELESGWKQMKIKKKKYKKHYQMKICK